MNIMTRLAIRAQARRDAEAGIEPDVERVVTALVGPKPRGAGTFEDALLLEQQGRGETFDMMNEDVETLENALAGHLPRIIYVLIALVCFAAEVGASAAALRAMGYEGAERLQLAFGFATGTVLLAGIATQIESRASRSITRWMVRLASAMLYLLVIAAAAWTRATDSEEALALVDVAASSIMLAVSTGAPGVVIHLVLARLLAAGDLSKRRGFIRRAQRAATRTRDLARSARVKMEREIAAWESEVAQVRALFLLELRRAQAEVARKRSRGS